MRSFYRLMFPQSDGQLRRPARKPGMAIDLEGESLAEPRG